MGEAPVSEGDCSYWSAMSWRRPDLPTSWGTSSLGGVDGDIQASYGRSRIDEGGAVTGSLRVGARGATIAALMWALFAVMVVITPDGTGANIGAGFVGLLAWGISLVSSARLALSAGSPTLRIAAGASLALWVAAFGLTSKADAATGLVLAVGLAAVVLLTVAGALASNQAASETDARWKA